jgi:hypothetical protein
MAGNDALRRLLRQLFGIRKHATSGGQGGILSIESHAS